jgi:hypothetical protein
VLHHGAASATVHLHGRGEHAVRVSYPGSRTVAPSASPKVWLRVT